MGSFRSINTIVIFCLLMMGAFAAGDRGDLLVKVVRESDELPVSGATVRVMNRTKTTTLFTAETDGSGVVRILGVPIGEHFVVVDSASEAQDGALLTVTSGARIRGDDPQ